MIKLSFILFIFSLILVSLLHSQNNVNVSINVSASLKKGINVISQNNSIDFGEIVLTNTPIEIYKSPQEGYKFKVISHPNKPIMITYDNVYLITNENFNSPNSNSIIFIPEVYHTNSNNQFIDPIRISSGVYYQPANNSSVGELNIWVGGILQIFQYNFQGDYSGNLVLTISY